MQSNRRNNKDNKQRSRDVNGGSPTLKETAKFGGDSDIKEMHMFDNPNALLSNGTDSKKHLPSIKSKKEAGGKTGDKKDEVDKRETPLSMISKNSFASNTKNKNKKASKTNPNNQSIMTGKGISVF